MVKAGLILVSSQNPVSSVGIGAQISLVLLPLHLYKGVSENHELAFEDNGSICSLLLSSYASCSKNYPGFRGDKALSARGLLQCFARCRWAALCSQFVQYSLSYVQWRTGTVERLSKQRFLFDAHCGHRLKSNTMLSRLSLFLAPWKNWLI